MLCWPSIVRFAFSGYMLTVWGGRIGVFPPGLARQWSVAISCWLSDLLDNARGLAFVAKQLGSCYASVVYLTEMVLEVTTRTYWGRSCLRRLSCLRPESSWQGKNLNLRPIVNSFSLSEHSAAFSHVCNHSIF